MHAVAVYNAGLDSISLHRDSFAYSADDVGSTALCWSLERAFTMVLGAVIIGTIDFLLCYNEARERSDPNFSWFSEERKASS